MPYLKSSCFAARLPEILLKSSLALGLLLLAELVVRAQAKSVLIQPDIQFQRLEGFGISIGGGCASEMVSLSGIERVRLWDLLFGPQGARINIIRNEIWWTGKRLPLTHPLYLRGFVYSFADEQNESDQFLVIREAQRRTEVIVNACVWSPPPQWKTNSSLDGGGELALNRYESFAEYLLGYLHYYKGMRNQDFHLLSLQDFPDLKQSKRGCRWSAAQLRDFIKIVGTQLKQQGYSTRIMIPEVEWDQAAPYSQVILEDAEARSMVSDLGAHSTPESSSGQATLNEMGKRHNLKLWQSEFTLPARSNSSDLEEGLQLFTRMLEDLIQAECHAWLYGAVLARSAEQRGLLEKLGNTLQTSKKFWAFSQFSRFLPRGSVRIAAQRATAPIVAFRNPEYDSIIILAINPTDEPITETLELRGWSMERMVAYRTSQQEDGTQVSLPPESGSKCSISLRSKSITTLVAHIRRTRTANS